jgi:membrane-associated protease RseP (regulator of RpoE activity)
VGLRFSSRDRIWLHGLLFFLCGLTTTALGARLAYNFRFNLPAFDLERDMLALPSVLRDPAAMLSGLPYSVTLLAILLAHEFGHYLACQYYRIDASLPYFLPAPTFIGTMGAFIRFRSAVKSRKELFDVGVAGPLAGFLFVIPALGIGLALSKVVPGIGNDGELRLGTPLLLLLAERVAFPWAADVDIYLHPVARAAWVGLLATALNLLPIGQLDGGHVVYALYGDRHRLISTCAIVALLPLGFLYWPWFVWAAGLFYLGRRHFSVVDASPLSTGRQQVALLVLLIFALSFIPAPVMYNGEQGWLP